MQLPIRAKRAAILSAAIVFGLGAAKGESIVITEVDVVDVVANAIRPRLTVAITGNRISSLGMTSGSLSQRVRTIDGRGRFLIPGLWDMHVHLGNATEAALPMLVASGITGVRDMGSPSFETLRRWRVESMAGLRIGPRIVSSGPILDGGAPDANRIIVRDEDEARRAVRLLAEVGVDFIKVHEHMSREVYFAIADETAKLGLSFAGHVPSTDMSFTVTGIEASNAGQKSLEHLFGIPFPGDKSIPALIETLRRNNTWVVPTLTVFWNRAHFRELAARTDPRDEFVAPALKQFWGMSTLGWSSNATFPEKLLAWRKAGVTELHKAGIPLLAAPTWDFHTSTQVI